MSSKNVMKFFMTISEKLWDECRGREEEKRGIQYTRN